MPFPIDDGSRVGEARRHAARLCSAAGWDEMQAGRLALVVTELGTNLLRHAAKGRLLIAAREAFDDIEVVSIDEGPGIADIPRSMEDGYSTGGGSPGTGLGAVRRLANSFDLYSTAPHGTVCVARVGRVPPSPSPSTDGNAPAYAFGAICVPVHGETVCGDGWGVALDESDATLMVADGLGHGPQAAKASQAALDQFAEAPACDLRDLIEQAHARLGGTRGAAVCALRIDGEAQQLQCAGAGNVAVRVVSGVFDRSMATQHGTVGVQIRKPDISKLALPPHGIAIVFSDGLASRWDTASILPVLERDPVLVAAILFRDFSRGRDDATVLVARREAA